MLPETRFRGSPRAAAISRAARQGDGEEVWSKIATNARTWNPKSSYKNDKFHQHKIHLECRRNIPVIDKNMVNRLKSLSLMVTSLMTALHDTTISDLNSGFKEATLHFKKINEDTQRILEVTSDNHDIKAILKMMQDTANIMQSVMGELTDDAWTIIELTVAGVIILFSKINISYHNFQ